MAKDKDILTNAERLEILNDVAYYELSIVGNNDDSDIIKFDEGMEKYYLKISDKEFENEFREYIKTAIKQKNEGKKIYWNKNFVEGKIKKYSPDLYNEVISQIEHSKQIDVEINSFSNLTLNSTNTTETFVGYGTNIYGGRLFGLFCTATWGWNGSTISNCVTSTWGEPYAIGWSYNKVVRSIEEPLYNNTRYYILKRGHFTLDVGGVVLNNGYVTLDIHLYSDGDSACIVTEG